MLTLSANTSRFLFSAADTQFLVTGFSAEEAICQPFKVKIQFATEKDTPIEDIPGKPGLLTLKSREQDRYFHGIIHDIEKISETGRFYLYSAVLKPQISLLEHRSDCRNFLDMDVTQIIAKVLKDAGVPPDLYTFRLINKYPQREYCVQYCETDLHFIQRLLAQEGIFYFFEHSREKHLMVFGDSQVNYMPIGGSSQVLFNPGSGQVAEQETIIGLERKTQIASEQFAQGAFNFENPAMILDTSHKSEEDAPLALYDYPGNYTIEEQGRRLTRVRLEQTVMDAEQVNGKSVVPRFIPGFMFNIHDWLENDFDGAYLLTGIKHEGSQPQVLAQKSSTSEGASYLNRFTAVPANVTIRPPKPEPAPQIGMQTAIVTGPVGEEIYTDRHGRVKVQFDWDRYGKYNEQSSCWIRVSQARAGQGWGTMHLPRIGQEVIAAFHNSGPDRPYVQTRVYNGQNMPPYELPAQKTITTVKSLSSPGGQGFNEIRLQDKKLDEQLFIHAERDMDERIKNDRRAFVGNNDHRIVENDLYEQINDAHHLTIKSDRIKNVDGSEDLTTASDRQHKVGAGYSIQAASQIHTVANSELIIESKSAMTVKTGPSFITIKDGNIKLSGPNIKINKGGKPQSGPGVSAELPTEPEQADKDLPGEVQKKLPPKTVSADDPTAYEAVPYEEDAPYQEAGLYQKALAYRLIGVAAGLNLKKAAEKKALETAWIEAKLVDQDNNPVPEELFSVIGPDKTLKTARTGKDGSCKITGLVSGSCELTWSNLDQEAWSCSLPQTRIESRQVAEHTCRVSPGNDLLTIARRYGYYDWQKIWDSPFNEKLKSERTDPMSLMHPDNGEKGDTLSIPENDIKFVQATTNQTYTFTLKRQKVWFRKIILDYDQQPVAGADYHLVLNEKEDEPITGKTNADGLLETQIPADAKTCSLTIPGGLCNGVEDLVISLDVGANTPVENPSGRQNRMHHLQYTSEMSADEDSDTTQSATGLYGDRHLSGQDTDEIITAKLEELHQKNQ